VAAERFVVRYVVSCLLICTAVGVPCTTSAQSGASSVGILRAAGPDVPAELAGRVDDALLRDLAGLAGIDQPTVFPANYDALQLAVGCEGETRECLSSIAITVKTDAILVRRLSVDADGLATLDLSYFEVAAGAEATRAQATVPANPSSGVVATVPTLVRRLFGLNEAEAVRASAPAAGVATAAPVASHEAVAEPAPERDEGPRAEDAPPPETHGGGIGGWTWATLITGGVVLGAGAIVGATAQSSFDALNQEDPQTQSDVRSLNEQFDSVETRGTAATVLMAVGGAALATGLVLLVLDLTGGQPDSDSVARNVGVMPLTGGAALTLHGSFGRL
jgi:hypothetical protein